MTGQRGGHAVEDAATVEERANKPGILLQLIRSVELNTNIVSIGLQSFADCLQQPPWVDRVMHDIEGGDQIVLLRQTLRDVPVYEAYPISYTCCLSIGCGSSNRWSE